MTQETTQSDANVKSPFMQMLYDTIDKFVSTSRTHEVFAPPQREGNVTVIPCAEVSSWMFFGLGYGGGGAKEQGNNGEGGGNGGGGNGYARPVAAIEVTSTGVTVKPIIDNTKIALAAFASVGVITTMLYRLLKHRR
jgi:uncharacterized spore protein YtfJ